MEEYKKYIEEKNHNPINDEENDMTINAKVYNTNVIIEINCKKNKFEVFYPKRKAFSEKLFNNKKYDLKNYNCKNKFLTKHKDILEKISYFSENPPKFLTHIIIRIKNEIIYFIQKEINENIVKDPNIYQLNRIDYETFVKNTSKNFNDNNLIKKIDEIFIEFQGDNEGKLKDNNEKVIKHMKDNKYDYMGALDYLGKTFYEIFSIFNEKYLEKYLKKTEDELNEKGIRKEKIFALLIIIKKVSKEYKDYFDSIDERKSKEKKI